ncbi:MAG: ComEC/Rec2 family competence protein [bacterium]|nr:ComEC/Rec2 family competence protein [bacterium]
MSRGVYFKAPILILAFLSGVALRSFFNVPNWAVFAGIGLIVGLGLVSRLAFFSAEYNIPHPPAPSPYQGEGERKEILISFPGVRLRFALFFIFFLLLGILRFSYFENNIVKDELHLHYGEEISLTGIVLSSENKENSARVVLKTDLGRLRVIKRIYPEYKYGDILEVRGKITEPVNFADFDVKKYLAKSEIYAEMIFPEISGSREQNSPALSPLFLIKDAFENNLRNILPEPAASLADGMLLGNQGSLDKELVDDFRKSGTIHILVLSGYNITIVGVFVMAFFGFIVPEAAAWVLALLAIIGFTLMAGAEAAAVRSAIMAIIGLLALRSGRKSFAISALMWAAFLMILWNPMLMRFDRGFQLSFLATLGLIVASPFFKKIFKFVPDIFGLRDAATSAFSAQIFVLPLLLSWGGEISWLSPFANILIVGAVPLVMLFSFLGGTAAFLSVSLGKIIASAAYILMSYQIFFVKFFGSLGFSMVQFSFLPVFILFAVYAVLFYWSFKEYVKVF